MKMTEAHVVAVERRASECLLLRADARAKAKAQHAGGHHWKARELKAFCAAMLDEHRLFSEVAAHLRELMK